MPTTTRNPADPDRPDMLPEPTTLLGPDRSQTWTDWRDAATAVPNPVVLWSFARDRTRISHHHVEGPRLPAHLRPEGPAGRARRETVD